MFIWNDICKCLHKIKCIYTYMWGWAPGSIYSVLSGNKLFLAFFKGKDTKWTRKVNNFTPLPALRQCHWCAMSGKNQDKMTRDSLIRCGHRASRHQWASAQAKVGKSHPCQVLLAPCYRRCCISITISNRCYKTMTKGRSCTQILVKFLVGSKHRYIIITST